MQRLIERVDELEKERDQERERYNTLLLALNQANTKIDDLEAEVKQMDSPEPSPQLVDAKHQDPESGTT